MNSEKRIFKIEDFNKCPMCQSTVLYKEKDRLECGGCGFVLTQNCCFTKKGVPIDEQIIENNIKKKRNKMY